jgi:hypothetical protein
MSLDHHVEPAAIPILAPFRFVGTQSIEVGGHFAVAGGRRENVQAFPRGWRHRRPVGPLRRIATKRVGADGKRLSNRRHPRGWPGWILEPPRPGGGGDRVVDAASIPVPRRRKRAKTDKIDGEMLLRILMAFKRGDPRVCSMARAPTPEEEDRRHACGERKDLITERVGHVNRIKGLLFSQGIRGYEPLHRDRRAALELLQTGDGRALAPRLKTRIGRELDRIERLIEQIEAVESERNAMLKAETETAVSPLLPAEV